ncbi:hypothetical protein K438DRAFT_1762168 [Mycena galopus ATCC 62051]|nr:hypothetical protein K438DRAFT_1762168 [Mycena galopus ATCC 62051]
MSKVRLELAHSGNCGEEGKVVRRESVKEIKTRVRVHLLHIRMWTPSDIGDSAVFMGSVCVGGSNWRWNNPGGSRIQGRGNSKSGTIAAGTGSPTAPCAWLGSGTGSGCESAEYWCGRVRRLRRLISRGASNKIGGMSAASPGTSSAHECSVPAGMVQTEAMEAPLPVPVPFLLWLCALITPFPSHRTVFPWHGTFRIVGPGTDRVVLGSSHGVKKRGKGVGCE